MRPDGRYVHFDGLRGIAALNVALAHFLTAFDFAIYSGFPASSHWGWDLSLSAWPFVLPAAGADFSVCVFLVLSGFVLAHAIHLAARVGSWVQTAADGVRATLSRRLTR